MEGCGDDCVFEELVDDSDSSPIAAALLPVGGELCDDPITLLLLLLLLLLLCSCVISYCIVIVVRLTF